MKKTMVGILLLTLIFIIVNCSTDPRPEIRVRNEGMENVNVKIQTSANTEIKINDVEPGQTSEYQSTTAGNITATAVSQNESISFTAEMETRYTIVLNPGKPPSIQIDN
jgi:hypothetical protein